MNKNKFKLLFTILIPMLIASSAEKLAYADDAYTYNQCYSSRINDTKVGYSCIKQHNVTNFNTNYIITDSYIEQELERFGFIIKNTKDIHYKELEDGTALSFSAQYNTNNEATKIDGEITKTQDKTSLVKIKTISKDSEKTKEFEVNEDVLFAYGIKELFKNNQNADTIEYTTLDPSFEFRLINVKAQKLEKETVNLDNSNIECTKYKVTNDLLPNSDNYEWRDQNGNLIKEKSSTLNIEQIAVSENPTNKNVPNYAFIPTDTGLQDNIDYEYITYKIENSHNRIDNFVNNNRQRIIQSKDNTIYLKIKNENFIQNIDKYKYPINTNNMDEFLKSNKFIMPNNQEIKKLSALLIKNKTNAYQTAKTFESWINKNIATEQTNGTLNNSASVLKTKSGNTLEKSLLLASLLRSAEIPAQIATGVMFTDSSQKGFIYKSWVKAYVGEWINLDPEVIKDNFSPSHIAFYETGFNSSSDKDNCYLNLINQFNDYKIEILNFEPLDTSKVINPAKKEKFNLLEFLNSQEKTVKKTENTDSSSENTTVTENQNFNDYNSYLNIGLNQFKDGNIVDAIDNFNKSAKLIPYNDDFAEIIFAKKMLTLGLFNLADNEIKNINDKEIWNLQIRDLKRVFYPKIFPQNSQELLLASILSNVEFNPQNSTADKSIEIINKNEFILENLLEISDYANYILAKAYKANKNYIKSLNLIEKAINLNPENLNYQLELANIYIQKEDYKSANKKLNEISQKFSKNSLYYQSFIKELEKSKIFTLHKLQKSGSPLYYYYLAEFNALNGNSDEAQDILKKLLEQKYQSPEMYCLIAQLCSKENDFETAKSYYNKALKIKSNDTKALLGTANILLMENNYNTALSLYLKVVNNNNRSKEALLKIGSIYDTMGKNEKALVYYKKVLEIDKYDCVANYYLGLNYIAAGDVEKAVKAFKSSIASNPDFEKSWIELARIEMNKRNNFLAKAYLVPLTYINNQNADYYFYMGLIDKNNENFTNAKNNFIKAIELNPSYSKAIIELQKINQ